MTFKTNANSHTFEYHVIFKMLRFFFKIPLWESFISPQSVSIFLGLYLYVCGTGGLTVQPKVARKDQQGPFALGL